MFISSRTGRKGFTLVELLVTVSIIALLVAILLPALGRARRSALAAASSANLSAMGRGMTIFANEDANGEYTTGAFDWYRDGDVREVGFVADLIDAGVITAGDALDPANPHKVSEKVIDYAGLKNSSGNTAEYWEEIAGTDDAASATLKAVGELPSNIGDLQEMFKAGYNTNYAVSWQLVRGDPVQSFRGSGDKKPEDGTGRLTLDVASSAKGGAAKIPLMAESRSGSVKDASLSSSVSSGPAEVGFGAIWDDPSQSRQYYLNQFAGEDADSGAWAVEAFCDGMNAADNRASAGNPVTAISALQAGGSDADKTRILHEFNDFWPHQLAKRDDIEIGSDNLELEAVFVEGFCNVLYADFHVARVVDAGGIQGQRKGDGWLGAFPRFAGSGDFKEFTITDDIDVEIESTSTGVLGTTYYGGGGANEGA